ncbi:predicted protein [Naegleria gruberi]|uniref:Copper transport protein n=1 Tax=Naegleria gruberi TaxID=5762 RepID=D2UZL8_NAEGR|nr:uncharacterized protein NAEGRDRAFT_61987 [Naegleria gruberi]EFC49964.1 predicted protein [Naegleria gruberi]|eukprot:XP_002682708.1 predicted protein [Naegleria gruberi strain NEG-M]
MCQHHQMIHSMMHSSSSGMDHMMQNSKPMMMDMGGNSTHHMLMYFSPQSFEPFVKYILFQNWNADNEWKYALSVIGIFLIAFFNQFIFFALHVQVDRKKRRILHYVISYICKPLGFFLEMSIGYLLMLVSMTYNFGLFMAIVMGNFVGYIIFNMICTSMLEGHYHQDQVEEEEKEEEVEHECCKKRKEYEKINDTDVKRYDGFTSTSMNIQRNNFDDFVEGASPSVRHLHDEY